MYPVDQWFGSFELTTGRGDPVSTAPAHAWQAHRIPSSDYVQHSASLTSAGDLTYLVQTPTWRACEWRILMWGTASAKTVTLQFGVQAQMAGTYRVSSRISASSSTSGRIRDASGDTIRLERSVFPLDIREGFVNTLGVTAAGTWRSGNNDHRDAGWFQVTAGAGQTGNIMARTTSYLQLFDVGLYEGTVAPPFMVPDYVSELLACKRYFNKFGANAVAFEPFGTGYCNSTSIFYAVINYSQMRAAPTAAASAPATFVANIRRQ